MGLVEVGGAAQAKAGELACGDAWLHLERGSKVLLAIVDGIGHGVGAAQAAQQTIDLVRAHARLEEEPLGLAGLLQALHQQLRGTRGVVASVVHLEATTGQIQYAGIGNTEVRLIGGPASLYSRPGLLGGNRPIRPVTQQVVLPALGLLILHTDGLSPGDLRDRPDGLTCSQLAQYLIERWARPDDDATVVVARRREGE